MTFPTSDAQSSRALPHRPQPPQTPYTALPTYSTPTPPPSVPPTFLPPLPVPEESFPSEVTEDRAVNFASHSWDLATGGLKTLTAKRELPVLMERRPTDRQLDTANVPRSYLFLLIILICLLLMLISGGVVLFVMLQP